MNALVSMQPRSARNPHERRRGQPLPLFSGVLALFWILAVQCLRADVCDVQVGIIATAGLTGDTAAARAWTDRILPGLSTPGFRFINQTEGAPAPDASSDYLVLVTFPEPGLGPPEARMVDGQSAVVLGAIGGVSEESLLAWIRKTVPEKAVPFRLPGRGEGPPVEDRDGRG